MPDECRGRYDTAIFTTLDNICEDCYNLYKEPDIHSMCRSRIETNYNASSCCFSGLTASVPAIFNTVFRLCYWRRIDLLIWPRL